MNIKTLFNLSYGMYIIGVKDSSGKNVGCVVNTVTQSTANPVTLTICLHKDNYTTSAINKSKTFTVSILSENIKESAIGVFGFNSSRNKDKFAEVPFALTSAGLPYVTEGVCGYLECKVIDFTENFTHTIFIAEVQSAEVLSSEPPMTYSYYHKIIKGTAPPNASTYVKEEPVGEIKSNYIKEKNKMKKFICSICGYVHEGESAPEKCPQCKAPATKFNEQSGSELAFADEHRVGVAKDVDPEIVEGLRQNFLGECTEVGMYLAMSRQADREGFPEIAEAYKRIAFEEAEHAAKFAELLGEVLDVSTKKNLEMRVMAEHGATQGKKDLAVKAKQLNLDAIHDTVHEMCKDEARHGMAFQGLLKRYF